MLRVHDLVEEVIVATHMCVQTCARKCVRMCVGILSNVCSCICECVSMYFLSIKESVFVYIFFVNSEHGSNLALFHSSTQTRTNTHGESFIETELGKKKKS